MCVVICDLSLFCSDLGQVQPALFTNSVHTIPDWWNTFSSHCHNDATNTLFHEFIVTTIFFAINSSFTYIFSTASAMSPKTRSLIYLFVKFFCPRMLAEVFRTLSQRNRSAQAKCGCGAHRTDTNSLLAICECGFVWPQHIKPKLADTNLSSLKQLKSIQMITRARCERCVHENIVHNCSFWLTNIKIKTTTTATNIYLYPHQRLFSVRITKPIC